MKEKIQQVKEYSIQIQIQVRVIHVANRTAFL